MPRAFFGRFESVDIVLLSAAVLGAALYLGALPFVHPDRAVGDRISEAGAGDAAQAFAVQHLGEEFSQRHTSVEIRRDPALLDSLQRRFGRSSAVRLVREEDLPAYFWSVQLPVGDAAPTPQGNVEFGVMTDDGNEGHGVDVRLTLDGRPFQISVEDDFEFRQLLHEGALLELMEDTLRYAMFDSVGADRWTFRFNDRPMFQRGRGRPAPPSRGLNGPLSVRPFFLRPEARILLDEADASALARFHLRGTVLAGAHVDSVTASGEAGWATATVHVSSTDTTLGRRFTADVEVAPTGALVGVTPRFIRDAAPSGMDADDVLDFMEFAILLLLSVAAFILFLQRLRHQLVDLGGAFRDGLLAAIAAAVALLLGVLSETILRPSFELFMAGVGLTLVALLAGILVFFISGAAGSAARDVWAEKLETLDLVREAYVRNVPVGLSLLRGTLFGFAAAGFITIAIWVGPAGLLALSGESFLYTSDVFGTSFLAAAAGDVYKALFFTYLAIVGAASLLRKRTASPVLVVGVVALVLVLIRFSPVDLDSAPVAYVVLALLGTALAWLFWRFDVLAVLAAVFVLSLLWDVAPGWVAYGSPEWTNAVLALLFTGGIGVAGSLGVAGGRTMEDVPIIIPEYIEDLARKERLERELELARSMQMSFLPRETPVVPGLDLASICVPAYEVGGDYYDFFLVDEHRIAFAVGDVSGKGMQAAFYMTLMKGILQSLVGDGTSPAAVLSKANHLFRKNAARNVFMSMSLGTIDVRGGSLRFARAGHNPLLVRRRDGRLEAYQPAGAALGLAGPGVFDGSIEEISIPLSVGDLCVVYTDGVTEAMNPRRELFGEKRLEAAIEDDQGSAHETLDRIVRDVHVFARGAPSHDDMTLVVARFVDSAYSSSSS